MSKLKLNGLNHELRNEIVIMSHLYSTCTRTYDLKQNLALWLQWNQHFLIVEYLYKIPLSPKNANLNFIVNVLYCILFSVRRLHTRKIGKVDIFNNIITNR